MKGTLTKVITTGAVLLTGTIPAIPAELQWMYAYQDDCASVHASADRIATSTPITDYPDYVPTCTKGTYSVAVFKDPKGNTVYIEIPDQKYTDMGKSNGQTQNPKDEVEYKSVFQTLIDLAVQPAIAAIGFDATSTNSAASGFSITFAATSTGSNLIMIGGAWDQSAGDSVTSFSYNAASGTKITSQTEPAGCGSKFDSAWYLINPASGVHNVVINRTNSAGILSASVGTYTGAKQSAQPDAFATSSVNSGTSLGATTTSVADNSWQVLTGRWGHGAGVTAGAGTIYRANDATVATYIFDSNAAKTPAGSVTLNSNWTGADCAAGIIISIAPAVSTTATPPRMQINGKMQIQSKTQVN